MVIGPDRSSAFPELNPGSHIRGLRFRPGAALTWLDTPLCELVGQATPLSQIWGHKALTIEARLQGASVTDRFALLLSLLETHDAGEPADDMHTLFERLRFGGANLRDTASDIAVGERTLRRRSQQHFGYGPKTLDRVLRLQRFLRDARDRRPDGLAALALNAGYADQAHMNREVKALTTLTPLAVRAQLSA